MTLIKTLARKRNDVRRFRIRTEMKATCFVANLLPEKGILGTVKQNLEANVEGQETAERLIKKYEESFIAPFLAVRDIVTTANEIGWTMPCTPERLREEALNR